MPAKTNRDPLHGREPKSAPDKKLALAERSRSGRTPPWLISFGDMMTLFLCFFIMLVTLAKTQDAGLMASGLGPFVAALESNGMDGVLPNEKSLKQINAYRVRFGLEPLTSEERDAAVPSAPPSSELTRIVRDALRPYGSLGQPAVASFAADSAELSVPGKRYLDLLADTLRPGQGQVLVLEGHADDAGDHDDSKLASMRALAVQDYLIREHGFVAVRVEARAFAHETRSLGAGSRCVDARLVQPIEIPES